MPSDLYLVIDVFFQVSYSRVGPLIKSDQVDISNSNNYYLTRIKKVQLICIAKVRKVQEFVD